MVDALRNMVEAVRSGGILLDLQVIRPNPRIESHGHVVCDVEGEPLLRKAEAAAAAVDALIGSRVLIEEAADDHEVLQHFADGADLVADFADRERRLPEEALPELRALAKPCVMREQCRLRRLQVT